MGASALVIPTLEPRSSFINFSIQTTLHYNMKFIEKISLLLISGASLVLTSCDGGGGGSDSGGQIDNGDQRAEALDVSDLLPGDVFVYTKTSGDLEFNDVEGGFKNFSSGETPESNGRFFRYQKTDTFKFEIQRVGPNATAEEQLPIILEIYLSGADFISTRFRELIAKGPNFTDEELDELVDIYNAGGAEIFRGDDGQLQAINDVLFKHEVTSSVSDQRGGGIMSGVYRLDTDALRIIVRKITDAELTGSGGRFIDPESWVLGVEGSFASEYINSGTFVINLSNGGDGGDGGETDIP